VFNTTVFIKIVTIRLFCVYQRLENGGKGGRFGWECCSVGILKLVFLCVLHYNLQPNSYYLALCVYQRLEVGGEGGG
jgi:hypothetical protein